MLPFVWVGAIGFASAVILMIALRLLRNREGEQLSRLRGEVEKRAARMRMRAEEVDKELQVACLGDADISEAVLAWQEAVTREGIVRLDGGQPWDWDTPELATWIDREVDEKKVEVIARSARNQAMATGLVLVIGPAVVIIGYVYLASLYVGGS